MGVVFDAFGGAGPFAIFAVAIALGIAICVYIALENKDGDAAIADRPFTQTLEG